MKQIRFLIIVCALAVGTLSGCAATQPPPGTYTAAGLKSFNADPLLKDVQALSQTAINLNAATGKEHLKDADTALVRDFALSAGAGLQSYANGHGTLQVVIDAYRTLSRGLSAEAKLNSTFKIVLGALDGAIRGIPPQ